MVHRLANRGRELVAVVLVTAWVLAGCNGSPAGGGPALGQIGDQKTTLGQPVTVPLTLVSDEVASLSVTATSSNEQVLPQTGIQVEGSGTDLSLRLSPSHEETGTTTVTVVAQDSGGQATREFALDVSLPFVDHQVLETKSSAPIGIALDIDGDTIVAGGLETVWTFVLDGDTWVEDQVIVPLENENYVEERFGGAVALEGDRLMIGASDTSGGYADQGLAYLFEKSTTGFSQVTFFADNDPSSQELLGRSVGVVGDHVFAGVPGGTVAGIESGAVSAFQRDPGGDWSLLGKLTPSDATTGTVFGDAMDASEGLLIIGDYANDERGTDAGAAYVFVSEGGFWTEAEKLAPAELETQDQFGVAVAGDGDWVMVSAWNDDEHGQESGAVYVFHDAGSGWQQTDVLYAPQPAAQMSFGSAVALQYPYAVIGAGDEDTLGTNAGAIYVFRHDGDTWHVVARLTSPEPAANARFGHRVALDGEYVVASQLDQNVLTVVFRR